MLEKMSVLRTASVAEAARTEAGRSQLRRRCPLRRVSSASPATMASALTTMNAMRAEARSLGIPSGASSRVAPGL